MPDPATGEIRSEDVVNYIDYEVFGDQIQQQEERRNPPLPVSSTVSTVAMGSTSQPSTFRPPSHVPPRFPSQPHGSTFFGSQKKTWRRSVVFCEVIDGCPSPLFQVFLTLNNETATSELVTEKVEQEAGVPVVLLDSKYLPIRSSESTKGSFWHGVRKIYAIPASQVNSMRVKKRKSGGESEPTDHNNELLSEMKKIRQDLAAAASANSDQESRSDQGVIEDSRQVKAFLEKVFKCSICYSLATLPTGVCSACHQVIGCIHCIEQWREEGHSVCPMCRSEEEYEKVPVIRQLQEPLSKMSASLEEAN